jgi:hypothetical protein
MLRLNLTAEPRWYDLGHGVRVECLPLTSGIVAAANASDVVKALPLGVDPDVRWQVFVKAVAMLCITAWEGVGDADGNALEVTPERVSVFMDLFAMSSAFAVQFVTPALLMAEEKKASAPLPNGSLAGALNTAEAAPKPAPNVRAN